MLQGIYSVTSLWTNPKLILERLVVAGWSPDSSEFGGGLKPVKTMTIV